MRRRQRGFTLIELLVVLSLLGLLASVAFPLAELQARRRQEEALRSALREIRLALDAYHDASLSGRIERATSASGYPPSLRALVDGVPDKSSVSGAKLYFLRRLPADPMRAPPAEDPAESWRLRSSTSPPDNPQAGKDVYDVMSDSQEIGLNGVPYAKW